MQSILSILFAVFLIVCLAETDASSKHGDEFRSVGRSPNRAKRQDAVASTPTAVLSTPMSVESTQMMDNVTQKAIEGIQNSTSAKGEGCTKCLTMHEVYTKSKDGDAEYISWCTKDNAFTAIACTDFLAAMRETATNGVSANNFCRILQRC